MSTDVLRLVVAILAVFVAGCTATITVRYLRASWRLGRSPGRILARHVAEVAAGTTGLVSGYAAAVAEQLGRDVWFDADIRLWLYLVSMTLLLAGVVEVGTYQRARARSHPQRQAQVRDAVRAAIDRQRVTGPHSADRAAVRVTNAVLDLEGTPRLAPAPEPGDGDYGRHALREDRRPS